MIVVTGASQGIGYACAKELLARTGSRVLITGRSEARLQRAREELSPGCCDRLETLVCDQACPRDVEALARLLAAPATELEGAILTVGVNPMYGEGPRRLHSLTADTIADTIRTNCTHALLLTAAILRRLRERRGGVLLWIGSQAQRVGLPGAGLYSATKSFLGGLARSAHNEYSGRGVRVHLLHPSVVRTPRTVGVVDRFAALHGVRVQEAAEVAARIVEVYLSGADTPVELEL